LIPIATNPPHYLGCDLPPLLRFVLLLLPLLVFPYLSGTMSAKPAAIRETMEKKRLLGD